MVYDSHFFVWKRFELRKVGMLCQQQKKLECYFVCVHCAEKVWNKCLEQWRCLSRFYHYLMQLWVTADGHWSRVTKSRVTSDHQQWPQLHYLVIKPRWTASLWGAFYFTPLRRCGHRQCTLFNDALHISQEWRHLVTARLRVKGHRNSKPSLDQKCQIL